MNMKKFLDDNYKDFAHDANISESNPDPLLVARDFKTHKYFAEIALLCALFSYGSAAQIVKFLQKINFDILDKDKFSDEIFEDFENTLYYRFQNSMDVKNALKLFRICIAEGGIARVLRKSADCEVSESRSLNAILGAAKYLDSLSLKIGAKTAGMDFLLGASKGLSAIDFENPNAQNFKAKNFSPLKRWNMFMRWMVRRSDIDFGVFDFVKPNELVIPLDTHTFKVSRSLGLLARKTYDLQAALELTQILKNFDALDPIKYDFALYRIGQGDLLTSRI